MMGTPFRRTWVVPPSTTKLLAAGAYTFTAQTYEIPLHSFFHGYRVTARVDGVNFSGMLLIVANDLGGSVAQALPVDPFDPAAQLDGIGEIIGQHYIAPQISTSPQSASVTTAVGPSLTDVIPALGVPVTLNTLSVVTTAAGGEIDVQTAGGTKLFVAPGSGVAEHTITFPGGIQLGTGALPLQANALAATAAARVTATYTTQTAPPSRTTGKLDVVAPFVLVGPTTLTVYMCVKNESQSANPAAYPGYTFAVHAIEAPTPLETWS